MKILVTGGRNFSDRDLVHSTLDTIHLSTPIALLIHGGATGADALAASWASLHSIPLACILPDWKLHGRMAGPVRNALMLDRHRPDLVLAFEGGRGTADMARRAQALGTPVRFVGTPPCNERLFR